MDKRTGSMQPVLSLFVTIALASSLAVCWSKWRALRRNIEAAKATGLPYVVAPFAALETSWLLCEPVLLPVLKCLPTSWTASWLPLASLREMWRAAYLPFCHAGADVLLIVTPSSLSLWSCDADVNEQVLGSTRKGHFPKNVEILGSMNTWGRSLPATEGEQARHTRRAVAKCFSESTHKRVWQFGVDRAGRLIDDMPSVDRPAAKVFDVVKDCKRFTLSVICAVCYGMDFESKQANLVPPGFELSFGDAVAGAFRHFFTIFLFPKLLLRTLPIRSLNEAFLMFQEWEKHVGALRERERERQDKSKEVSSKSDVLGHLVADEIQPDQPHEGHLPKDMVLGNISLFVVAGHETSTYSLTYVAALLAVRQDIQDKLHQELEYVFGASRIAGPETWSYEKDFPLLLNGLVGAVLNETLRVFPLSPMSPRKTTAEERIWVNGKVSLLPAGCRLYCSIPATHDNPNYWESETCTADERRAEMMQEDSCASRGYISRSKLGQWDPTRWLDKCPACALDRRSGATTEQRSHGHDHGHGLFGPLRTQTEGSFLPFSRGPRICIGSRFASAEMCACLASLLARHQLRVDARNFESEASAIESVMEAITNGTDISITYKPAEGIRLMLVPR